MVHCCFVLIPLLAFIFKQYESFIGNCLLSFRKPNECEVDKVDIELKVVTDFGLVLVQFAGI